MKLILVVLLTFLVSCASAQMRQDLLPHIQTFEKYCNCKVKVPIKIVPIPKSKKDIKEGTRTLGICYGFKMSKIWRSIEIDEMYWKYASECERESTVLHELAHCELDMDHEEAWLWKDFYLFMRPKSLMHPYSFPQYCTHRTEYIEELFKRKK